MLYCIKNGIKYTAIKNILSINTDIIVYRIFIFFIMKYRIDYL